MKQLHNRIELILVFLMAAIFVNAENIVINNYHQKKQIVFGNSKLMISLDYNKKCCITGLTVNWQTVISGSEGIFSEIKTAANNYSTRILTENPIVKTTNNTVSISGIKYGEADKNVTEKWDFTITETNIEFEIKRNVAKDIAVEEMAFPSFNFDNINTWNGAFLGYGGLAWFYLFNEKLCTYGVHTNQSVFWNSATGNALKVDVAAEEQKVAMKFSRSEDDRMRARVK